MVDSHLRNIPVKLFQNLSIVIAEEVVKSLFLFIALAAILFNVAVGCLVGCFGFNGPLRQYFSLYRAVSQREGEREEKG